jgi:pimeloyl-ACP methyl ester carboxylesterase
MMSTRHVDVGGHHLRVGVEGRGPPDFVCLHGLADGLDVWHAMLAPLAARGRVVVLDQRAHGGSEAPPGPYRREDLAADVLAILDRLDIARAALIGHSLGGVVAMTAALARPERIAGLVLLGTASQASPEVARWYEQIARAAETEGLEGLARAIFGPATRRALRGNAEGLAHVTRCLKGLAEDPLTPRLHALECPVLIVAGDADPMGVGPSVVIQRHLPGATLEVIPGHGHWVHVSAPDALLALIDRFLETRAPATARPPGGMA